MSATRERQTYGTITVVGGGCYGSWYVRQLQRAARAGALTWERLVVVDRDAACQFARTDALAEPAGDATGAELVVSPWREHFASAISACGERDAIVPSPLMPHLMVEWIIDRVRARWPAREAGLKALSAALPVPWQMANGDAPHYASFATWTCPVNCIEPATCPHTRGARDWSMPVAMRAYVDERRGAGEALGGPLLFHCEHRAYGVGMFGAAVVRDAGATVLAAAEQGPCEFLVGTVSHCHGALGRLVVGPRA
ncbi:MAG: hypothetical protein HY275_06650 [Gemmatimonadetes bacterium]|nr:hypothetical protein [Gemmatimonadota bacterium]